VSVSESRAKQGTGVEGACYLLHFEPQFKHAGRYVGWTSVQPGESALEAVQDRFDVHMSGKGSPLVRAAVEAGCVVVIARVWEGVDRHFERAIKEGKNSKRLDPISMGQLTLAEAIERHHG
jgi:hypothetical protein